MHGVNRPHYLVLQALKAIVPASRKAQYHTIYEFIEAIINIVIEVSRADVVEYPFKLDLCLHVLLLLFRLDFGCVGFDQRKSFVDHVKEDKCKGKPIKFLLICVLAYQEYVVDKVVLDDFII